jgi:hypothetical protein|nr:MAG TPA: hypothetical protein [Caudoviricetes sp.]
MLHVVPILCLIFFIWFVEMQIKKEMHHISEEFKELKERITNNKDQIETNRTLIDQNRTDINKLGNGESL